jgi:hypothetical protein
MENMPRAEDAKAAGGPGRKSEARRPKAERNPKSEPIKVVGRKSPRVLGDRISSQLANILGYSNAKKRSANPLDESSNLCLSSCHSIPFADFASFA